MTNLIDEKHCLTHSDALNEKNDCAVRACAIATQIPYTVMRDYLSKYGRKHRDGMFYKEYSTALTDLGYVLRCLDGPKYEWREHWVEDTWHYKRGVATFVPGHFRGRRAKVGTGSDYDGATVVTLARELDRGTYLVNTHRHVLCLREGVVHDFTRGKRHRVRRVFEVTGGDNGR